ncbi:DUF4190 domain-containing protein [Nocardia cyriacigeorgica]|uniref:DUF4190 domain-containing protein n=1 Tax=Nocardia cyriacigeorgica TaxID=135487 RepID=A0A4U8W0V1_9NOCA|nr:DUF4190 domain-containing protein [Nocardia cyriacigeorgica]VFA99640.1 Uncharacterised protein [Nocardia cyriacigeorgica]
MSTPQQPQDPGSGDRPQDGEPRATPPEREPETSEPSSEAGEVTGSAPGEGAGTRPPSLDKPAGGAGTPGGEVPEQAWREQPRESGPGQAWSAQPGGVGSASGQPPSGQQPWGSGGAHPYGEQYPPGQQGEQFPQGHQGEQWGGGPGGTSGYPGYPEGAYPSATGGPGGEAGGGFPSYPQQSFQPYDAQPQRSGAQVFSIIGFVCAGICLLFCPILFGPAGIILGIIGHNKGEPLGKWAAIAAGVAMAIGLILTFAFFNADIVPEQN